MLRVLVLIGALLFFRAVLPNKARRSTTSVTPYINGLDGTMSVQQVSSVLDETITYESWLASHRAKQAEKHRPTTPCRTVRTTQNTRSAGPKATHGASSAGSRALSLAWYPSSETPAGGPDEQHLRGSEA
jgi:hypothetical protein